MTNQAGYQERGTPIGDRKVLENLDFRSRTTGEDAAARSRLVKRLRIVLPILALVMVAAFVFNTQSNSVDDAFLEDFKNIADATEELRMANPRFAGVDENGKPFEITAFAAKQAPDTRDVIELERPRAVQGGDEKQSTVTADNGIYRSEENILELTNSVQLEHKIAAGNYVLKLPAATVLLDEETVTGEKGVGGEGPDGAKLSADRMKAYRADGRVVFEGNVSMRIYPKSASLGELQDSESKKNEPQSE